MNVSLNLESQYCIRLPGLCSSVQGEVSLLPLIGDLRIVLSAFFVSLYNLTVFIPEIIAKLSDT